MDLDKWNPMLLLCDGENMICEKCNKMCKAIYPALGLMTCPECRVVYCPLVKKG